MGRLLLVFIVIALIAGVAHLWRGRAPVRRNARLGGNMIRCARCGLHVPEDEALRADGQAYCSREHAGAARLEDSG